MIECVCPDVIASSKDAPLYSEGLGEGPYLEGDPALETEVRYYPPTFSKNPLPVTVIDECHSTEFLCEIGNLVKRGDIAVHAEYPIGDDQFPFRVLFLPEDPLQSFHVVVRINRP